MRMTLYLRRDIDYLFAPYSYDQLFLKLPYDYAVEAASRSRIFITPEGAANSYWSQQYVEIDTTVDDLPNALRLGVRDPKIPRRWTAVLETKNPEWVWFLCDRPMEYEQFLSFIGLVGSIPFVPGMTQVLIQDHPDERELEDALGSRTGTKNLTVHSYDIHAAIGLSEPVPENGGEQFFDVGIGEGESRFQAFTQWPEAEEFHFPGLERLKAKKGPLRKRFTTQDLADCAHLFGLDPFNRDFLTGRATLINAGYPLAQAYGSSAIFDYPEHTWDREHERSEG